MSDTQQIEPGERQAANSGCPKRLVGAFIPGILHCSECGKIMTKLPTTAVCINRACGKAGILVARPNT